MKKVSKSIEIDTIMDEKLRILQSLIESEMFASSPAAFAKVLGYKGKMTIYRIIKGTITEKTVNEVWDRLLTRFFLEEDMLYCLYHILQANRFFSELIKTEMNMLHPRWMENLFISLFEGDYIYYSPDFKEKVVPMLKDLKKDTPDVFWGMVALFYIRQKDITPYSGIFKQTECGFLNDLNKLLSSLYPENSNAYQAGIHLKSVAERSEHTNSFWWLLYNGLLLLRYYAEPDFIRSALTVLQTFDWAHRSYWVIPGTAYHPKARVWALIENKMDTATYGFYIVLCLEMGKNTETFHLKETFALQFLSVTSEEDCPIAQVYKLVNQKKEICHYLYDYDSDAQTLHFSYNPEVGNLYNLPEAIHLINLSSPIGKDEKVWSKVLNKFEQDAGKKLYLESIGQITGIINLSDVYIIQDVIISRTHLSLILLEDKIEKEYKISTATYSFLTSINPSHSIIITKHINDACIYVEWPDLGYTIKLSEFNCYCSQ